MAILGKQLFDEARLDRFADYIRQSYENDTPQDFEIVVDGFRAVKRTCKPEMFDNYKHFIFPETKVIELLLYVGASNNNDKYVFAFSEEYLNGTGGLHGFDAGGQVNERFQKLKKNWEYTQLLEQNLALKEENAELQQQLDALEEEKFEMQQSQSPLKSVLGEIGSSFVESFIRRNPNVLEHFPGGQALAGMFDEKKPVLASGPQAETEVSFKKSSPVSGSQLGEAEKAAIQFVEQLKSQFSELEFNKLLEILELFAADKSRIGKVLNLLNAKNDEQVQL